MTNLNPYAAEYAHFAKMTKGHQLTVELGVGLNRRLRVGTPGSNIWSWRVATWPGYLTTFGDIANGYTFSRITDMLNFFRTRSHYPDGCPVIDLRYWAEKLQGPAGNSVRTFSNQRFTASVKECLDEHSDLGTLAISDLEDDLAETEDEPERTRLQAQLDRLHAERDEVIEGAERLRDLDDVIDWLNDAGNTHYVGELHLDDLRDWDIHFLYTCWAIALTVQLWDAHVAQHGTGDGFAIVEGGLVTNDPGLPTFDLDVLGTDDPEALGEVVDLFTRIAAHSNRIAAQPYLDQVVQWLRPHATDDKLRARIDTTLERRARPE